LREDNAPVQIDPDFWRRRRVLITGHTGFKGAWLSLWLRSLGADVSGLAQGPPIRLSLYQQARLAEEVHEHPVDVRDGAGVARAMLEAAPEVVIHMAAQPMVRRSLREPALTYEVNVMGTVNVLEAVRALGGGVAAVLVVTSDKCYAQNGSQAPFREGDPLGGGDPYSSSKAAAELVVAAYRSSYFSSATSTALATARAGNVIGGGDWGEDRLLPDVERAVAAGRPLAVRNPDAVRPWQHVLNPLGGYLQLAEGLCRGEPLPPAVNFGPPPEDARPVRWILQRLEELWEGRLQWVADVEGNPPEAMWLELDSGIARERLGWRPRWDLDRALREIVSWHRAHRAGEDMRRYSLLQLECFLASPPL
jgi:CDP-glucose 4,6-dehydratase